MLTLNQAHDPRRRKKFHEDYYIRGSVKDLESLIPVIDWNRFLERIVEMGDTPLAEFDSFEVLINAKDYLNDLRGLLDQTSDETLHNYLLWRLVLSSKIFSDFFLLQELP